MMNLASHLNRQTKMHRNHPGYKASQDLFHIFQNKVQKNNSVSSVNVARLSTSGVCYKKCKLKNLLNFETKPIIFHQIIYCSLLIPCSVAVCCNLWFCSSSPFLVVFGHTTWHSLWVRTEICWETLCSFVLFLHSIGIGRAVLETKR